MIICNICLRSRKNLRSIINLELENFYDELCDYGNWPKSKFCSECLYKLKKFYEFKKNCHLAVNTLKEWNKKHHKAEKMPKCLLHTKIPEPQLSLCNKSNFKVYFYQTADVDGTASIQMPSSKYPHIVTVNIPRADNIKKPGPSKLVDNDDEKVINLISKEDIKEEFWVELDNNKNVSQEMNDVSKDISEYTKQAVKKHDDDENSDNDKGLSNDEAVNSDSDESIKELDILISTLKKKQEPLSGQGSKPKKKTKYAIKPVNLVELKANLKKKFDKYGTIKDDKGNVIDKESVLNNFHKMAHLRTIYNLCLVPGPFSQLAIRKLTQIHKRFADSSIYDTLCLPTHEEMLAEFEKRRQCLSYTKHSHRCESCLMGFMNHALLDYHNKFSHNPALPFECSICHIRKSTRLRLTHHRLSHKNVLKCKLCTFMTGTRSSMIHHANKHKGVTYKCKFCDNVYRAKAALAAHMNRMHGARHVCALCAAALRSPPALKLHLLKKHLGEEFVKSEDNTKCEECDVLFVSNDVYQKHIMITHKVGQQKLRTRGKMIYSCRLCDWSGSTRLMQMEHYQTEHSDADSTVLYNGYKYLCHDCGKGFQREEKYTEHMNRHSGTRPYACNICPKTFFSRTTHQTHMLRHLPPSKECPHCGKKFTTTSGLGLHVRIHTNDRRFKCNICGKGFLSNGALQQHVAGVHYNIRRERKPRQQDISHELL